MKRNKSDKKGECNRFKGGLSNEVNKVVNKREDAETFGDSTMSREHACRGCNFRLWLRVKIDWGKLIKHRAPD